MFYREETKKIITIAVPIVGGIIILAILLSLFAYYCSSQPMYCVLQGGDEENNYNSCSYSGRDNKTGYHVVLVCLLLFISAYVMCFVGRRRRR